MLYEPPYISEVKPFEPLAPPVSWPRVSLVSFRLPRAEIERELGAPQERDADSNGVGPMDVWAMRFPCGLEVLLLAFHRDASLARDVSADEPCWVEIQSNSTELEHIAAHLPFELVDISLWEPDLRTSPAAEWAVMRQDDNGHVFRVEEHASRCAAERAVQRLESGKHKQMYWLTALEPAR